MLQVVTEDVHKAYQAFFRRVKAGETPGYPRFKSSKRFHSVGFKEYGAGFRLDGRRLKLANVGRIRVRWHRPVAGRIKTARITHKAGRWYVSFACEGAGPAPLPQTGRAVGLDVGLSALITTSEGNKINNPSWYRAAQTRLRILQRRLARSQRGSKRRQRRLRTVQRGAEHIKNQRKVYCFSGLTPEIAR